MKESVLLETQRLTHVFPDGTIGIKDVNLRIYAGEFMVIAGTNGSGKSVLTRHLNGLLVPTEGEVLMDGMAIAKNIVKTRKRVGLIFQDSESQFVGQTVEEEAAFGPENLGLPRSEIDQLVAQTLTSVGLSSVSNRNPYTLSGGQKRKLAVAGVLVMKPRLIIFDEPFTGLDYLGVVQVLNQLTRLHQQGHTIVVITHELEKVLAHAHRLVVMHQGKCVCDGKPEKILPLVEKYGIRNPLKNGGRIGELTWLS